ncbi:hypothetical protein [Clostridium fallax]|uniref:Uncharacterized protein n=1 Tax=Clostridium fallax TaxID=1533 RepID=A0A1M4XV47_9CLOT|nr:hypothetical protein [Clostridium fallax]SHE97359.1 hypothetical protein SAMN05443638_12126 [Clostridium fallax]SQB06520.1 lipoprotein [Clostridium fallax]
MSKGKKIFISIITAIVILCVSLTCAYYFSFSPKVSVTPISSNITLNKAKLFAKFLPDNFKITSKEAYVESNTNFSSDELTNLFIIAVKENPELKDFITGLKVSIGNNDIDIYCDVKYLSLPMEAKLTFTGEAKDGKGVFHYKEGHIGFLSIPKDVIFSKLQNTSVVQFDKNNGDIILSFESIKELEVKNVTVENNKVNIVFRGTLKFKN